MTLNWAKPSQTQHKSTGDKRETGKFGFIKIKSFGASKDMIKKVKSETKKKKVKQGDQPTEWGKNHCKCCI